MQITIIFDQDTIDAFTGTYYYQEKIPNPDILTEMIQNPQTPEEFTKDKINGYILDVTKSYQINQAVKQASQEVVRNFSTSVQTSIDVTIKPLPPVIS